MVKSFSILNSQFDKIRARCLTNHSRHHPGQWVEFTSVLRMVNENEAVEEKIETMTPGTVRWPATAGTHRYIIRSVVRGVVAPGWSIPRGQA